MSTPREKFGKATGALGALSALVSITWDDDGRCGAVSVGGLRLYDRARRARRLARRLEERQQAKRDGK